MENTKTTEEKKYTLVLTEKEMNNVNLKRLIVQLVQEKAQLHCNEPFVEITSAEESIISRVPLFTPIKEYGEGKFPNEIGKLKSQRIVLKK